MLLPRTAVIVTACCFAAALAACSSPNGPSTSLVGSRPTSPSTGRTFSYYSQPVTLGVASGVTTGGTLLSIVEVATDAAFTTVMTTKTVVPDASGRMTITLDHLSPATTYYWRVKTSAGDNPGIVSSPQSFSIGPLLVIQPPTPVQPLADTFPHKRPMFTVGNATHTGPEATLTYRFDIATDSTFTNVVTSGTVPEGTGQTSFTATADLTPGTSYVWRAKASDTAKAVTSDYSRAQFFTTVFPEDGTFRYDLTLHMVSAAQCEWSGVGGGWPVPPLLIADFKVDDGLVVSGDHLRYGPLPGYCCIGDGLVLNIDRSGNQLSGIMSGEVTPLFVFDLTLAFFAPNILTGTADSPTGRFTGTISGGFNQHSGGLGSTGCASVFSFMLTPHP